MGASAFDFSYGYVLYQKRRDIESKRGWTQQSFVLISELPLVGFYYRITELVARVDAQRSIELYKHLYEQSIKTWPLPEPPLSTVKVRVTLGDLVDEEMAICLPENLVRGLSKEQLEARTLFVK